MTPDYLSTTQLYSAAFNALKREQVHLNFVCKSILALSQQKSDESTVRLATKYEYVRDNPTLVVIENVLSNNFKGTLMKLIRRGLFILSFMAFIACIVFLLNITAPNPTHRRYSSLTVRVGGQASIQQIGTDGEQALAADLGLPRNDITPPRQYFCRKANGTATPPDGNCVAYYAGLTASFRRPDFVSDNLIGEAKNRAALSEDDRDLLNQIGDYSLVAITLHRPLWIYTRVDTDVDPKYQQLAAATGGGIVPYFSAAGYVDPVDAVAQKGLLTSAILITVTSVLELWSHRPRRNPLPAVMIPVKTPPDDRKPAPTPDSPLKRATNTLDHLGSFVDDSKANKRDQIDKT